MFCEKSEPDKRILGEAMRLGSEAARRLDAKRHRGEDAKSVSLSY